MGKGKPRHNSDKPQNKYGARCGILEEIPQPDGSVQLHCDCFGSTAADVKVCKGNRHNCIKTLFHREASKSNARKNNDFRRTKNEEKQKNNEFSTNR